MLSRFPLLPWASLPWTTSCRALTMAMATCCLLLMSSSSCFAQGGGGGGGGAGGGGTGDDPPQIFSGVAVDADGVLQRRSVNDPTGRLTRQRIQDSMARLDSDIAQRSPLRKVSLTRLARLIEKAIDEGHGPNDAMKHLAGLTRIQYVFYYPETQDIVLAGPAEGWMDTGAGRVVGLHTGQPVLELQDLVVALRAFPPNEKTNPLVHCSIDATPEGLQRMQQFLSGLGRQVPNGREQAFEQYVVDGLRENLGLQMITLGGISSKTHFAQVMVEADYRMKLIGLGLEQPPARIRSYLSLANFASIARNAMCRWWFVPDYQRIKMSEDGNAAEFVGNGVKLVGEDEVVARDGSRRQSGTQNRASRKFTQGFTQKYAQIAENAPVYGQLRNCVDMLVAAAFMQQQDLYGKAGWDLSVLGNEETYPVETYNAPQQVASAVNSMWKGRHLATPVGGGVQIEASRALDSENLLADDKGELAEARKSVDLSELPADQWWWD